MKLAIWLWIIGSLNAIALLCTSLLGEEAYITLQIAVIFFGFVGLWGNKIETLKGAGIEVTLQKIEKARDDVEEILSKAMPLICIGAMSGQRMTGENDFELRQHLYRSLIKKLSFHKDIVPDWVLQVSDIYRKFDEKTLSKEQRKSELQKMERIMFQAIQSIDEISPIAQQTDTEGTSLREAPDQ